MFSKLLKYEWKANAGLLGVLSACALGAGLLGAFVLKGILFMSERLEETVAALGITGLSSALMFICVALVAYLFAVQFINLFRFYKNKFTDEGYLTFTLPVSTRQIFLSSFLNILAWMVISFLVVTAAAGMILFIGASDPLKENNIEFSDIIEGMFGFMGEEMAGKPGYKAYSILTILSALFTPVYSLVVLMTGITVGSVLAKKHKILATIGICYCINFAVGFVESILTVVPAILAENVPYDAYFTYLSITVLISIILHIAVSIGGYFLSTHLMKHKLNLP